MSRDAVVQSIQTQIAQQEVNGGDKPKKIAKELITILKQVKLLDQYQPVSFEIPSLTKESKEDAIKSHIRTLHKKANQFSICNLRMEIGVELADLQQQSEKNLKFKAYLDDLLDFVKKLPQMTQVVHRSSLSKAGGKSASGSSTLPVVGQKAALRK